MNVPGQPPSDIEVFDAFTKKLMERLFISETMAVATQLTAMATALGPAVRVRNSFGHDLPLTFEFVHAGEVPPHNAGMAVSLSLAMIKTWGDTVTKWREDVGTAKLQACHSELIADVAYLEKEALKPLPALPPNSLGIYDSELARMKREQEEGRYKLLEAIAFKKQEVAQMQINMHPVLMAENLSWDTLLGPHRLTGDGAFTMISSDGRAIEALAALRGKKLQALAELLDASRIGRPAMRAAGNFTTALLNTAFVNDYASLSHVLNKQRIVESGTLDAAVFLDAAEKPVLNDETPAGENDTEQQWVALTARLFDYRASGNAVVFVTDKAAFDLFESFRSWSGEERFRGQNLRRFASRWPDILLKISLVFQVLIAGTAGGAVGAQAMSRAVRVMKPICEGHAILVKKFAASAPEQDAIARMTAKVMASGRLTRRSLFRKYDNQSYKRLQPVLNQAIAAGHLYLDGTYIMPGPNTLAMPGSPSNVVSAVSASVQKTSEMLEPMI